jgi:phenylacetic acid degradation operon negative regulatory protein
MPKQKNKMSKSKKTANSKQSKKQGGFAKEKRKRKIKDITWGVATTLTDLTLVAFFFSAQAGTRGRVSKKDWAEFQRQSAEGVDWDKIRKVLHRLKKQGFINYTKNKLKEPEITNQGIKRLKSIIPQYDNLRIWDNKVYLIIYDIPEEKRQHRDILREGLEKIGFAQLQRSVWLTPYNPKKIIKKLVKEKNLKGSIIVSDVGKDGSIGEKDLKELIFEVYKIEDLNQKYRDFVREVETKKLIGQQICFAYLSILKEDPQIPFQLLPDNWFGEDAYFIYKKELKKQKKIKKKKTNKQKQAK